MVQRLDSRFVGLYLCKIYPVIFLHLRTTLSKYNVDASQNK